MDDNLPEEVPPRPRLTVKLEPDVYVWLQARPEGPRHWIEAAVAAARGDEVKARSWWYDHVHAIIIGAWKNCVDCHGQAESSSVARRAAAQLASEITRMPSTEVEPRPLE